jgi:hypothetical protein
MADQSRSGLGDPSGAPTGPTAPGLEPASRLAWGGIGGSGRHAAEIMAELVKQPQVSRALDDLVSMRGVDELIKRQPNVAWGGIGGSGRHAEAIKPEER